MKHYLKIIFLSSIVATPFLSATIGIYYNSDAEQTTSVFDFVDTESIFNGK